MWLKTQGNSGGGSSTSSIEETFTASSSSFHEIHCNFEPKYAIFLHRYSTNNVLYLHLHDITNKKTFVYYNSTSSDATSSWSNSIIKDGNTIKYKAIDSGYEVQTYALIFGSTL